MIPEKDLKKMNTLCNGFANERVDSFVDELDELLNGTTDSDLLDGPIKKLLGKIIAISYAKGYGDCYENKGPSRLFI
jgi:hypothetical protein